MKKENGMNLKAKNYVEKHKKAAGEKLSARSAHLKTKGLEEAAIRRDPSIRKIKADIRKANFRLASIAAQEKLNAEKVRVKEMKLAGNKVAPDKTPVKHAKNDGGLKEKKEKKKKEKKA
jgi:hypothetical protein